jgi:hypothetical protein
VSADPIYDGVKDGLGVYTYCRNNPLIYTDPDGLEPTKKQAALFDTILKNIKIIENNDSLKDWNARLPQNTPDKLYSIFFGGKNSQRYFYTEKFGWIDITHTLAAAIAGYQKIKNKSEFIKKIFKTKLGFFLAKGALARRSRKRERNQTNDASKWGYDDLPSDLMGLIILHRYIEKYGYDSDVPFSDVIEEVINEYNPSDYKNAPNWNQMPEEETDKYTKGFPRNRTFIPKFRKRNKKNDEKNNNN